MKQKKYERFRNSLYIGNVLCRNSPFLPLSTPLPGRNSSFLQLMPPSRPGQQCRKLSMLNRILTSACSCFSYPMFVIDLKKPGELYTCSRQICILSSEDGSILAPPPPSGATLLVQPKTTKIRKMRVGKWTILTLFSVILVVAVSTLLAFHDEFAGYPTKSRSKISLDGAPRSRALVTTENDCDEIPMENIKSTWEWARGKRLTVAATGIMVYQNGNKLLEEYEPSNVCPIFCVIPPIRWIWNLFHQFGGSPTKRFSLFSGTKGWQRSCW